MESLITRFDYDNPCWTAELLKSEGEDAAPLPELVRRGLLSVTDGIYYLSESGAKEFERAAAVLFTGGKPGLKPADPPKSLMRTKLRLLLDRTHLQRWGLKDYHTDISLPFVPALDRDELFRLREEKLTWLYPENEAYKKLAEEFPTVEVDRRRVDIVPPGRAAELPDTLSPRAGALRADLLYLSRYDFMQYRDFKGHPNDSLRFINADRFVFVIAARDVADNLETVGKFHLWLNYLRRVQIPGYVDCDTQEQFSVTWLIFVTETEHEATHISGQLAQFGEEIIRNAGLCEIWTISLEALEEVEEKQEVVSELFTLAARPVQRVV